MSNYLFNIYKKSPFLTKIYKDTWLGGIIRFFVNIPPFFKFKQTRQYPSHRQPFGSKSRTGRLQQLGEHERKDDAGCQAIHDAGQLLHYRLQE